MPILTTLGAACAKAWGFTSGLAKDQYFNLVSLLLPGNGTNGAQNNTFLDGSSNNFTITRNGNTTQGTFSPFSQTGWGAYFDGSNDSLTVSSNAAFGFGTGDFCVEFWMYPTALTTARGIYLTNATGGLYIYTDTSNKLIVRASAVATLITSNDAISLNTWTHVAVCRTGTTLSLYLNGSRTAGGTASNSTNFAAGDLYIGVEINTFYYSGYLGSLRAVKGSAVYDPTATTITVPTAPLSAVSGTSLLTCQYNRFRDASSNGFTVTPNNGVAITPFSPFAPTAAYTTAAVGGSGYFDGTGDYLSVANTGLFGSGDWTVEMWINAPVGQTDKPILECRNPAAGSGSTAGFTLTLITSTEIRLYSGSELLKGTVNYINTWAHVAVSKKSGTTRLYLNGTSVASTASLGTMSDTTFLVAAGYYGSTSITAYGQFYMSGLRVLTGTGYDTSTITIPTSPPTAITNTSLLLNFTNAGITDATAKNDLETVGNAQISTSVSKFPGGGSIAFDGTGDYLVSRYPTADMTAFGTGDFTIEMWIRFTNASPTPERIFLDFRPGAGNQIAPMFYVLSNTVRYYVNGLDRITSATISSGQWYHLAVARSGTSTKMFIDGTQSGSTYPDSNNYISGASYPVIGAARDGTQGVDGYIDDLRITKGYARYTGNFTPPTAPFPVQ